MDLTGQPLASLHEGDVDEFALELAEGVAGQAPELDERISEASDEWRADRLGVVERKSSCAWASSSSTGDVPVEVAVDEAVSLARYASEDAGRLVNGILGRVVRSGRGSERARSVVRLQELLEKVEAARAQLERHRRTPSSVVHVLQELAELAKEVQAEVERARGRRG